MVVASYFLAPAVAVLAGVISGIVTAWFTRSSRSVIRHYVLRFVLYREGYIPPNYLGFLDFATHLIILRKVGQVYIFVHRYLLEYFAGLE